MTRIAILANSKRPDGQCLAGIDLSTGEWVRPVPTGGDGIPIIRCIVDHKLIAVRDVLEIDLVRPRITPEFQRENHVIRNWNWKLIGRLKWDALTKHVENESPILHTSNDRVSPRVLRSLPPSEWKSLQLVQPGDVTFARHYYDPNRWVANFSDDDGNDYSLKVTDALVTRRLEASQSISKNCILTVSMTKPWSHDPEQKPPLCYKVVAAVIELPPPPPVVRPPKR